MPLSLRDIVKERGSVPLGWAGATASMDYHNWGDAMSPVMVALLTGLPIERVPFKSEGPRLAAVGTIGHGFIGGEVWFWGSGYSPYAESHPTVDNTIIHVSATRGPLSASLLTQNGIVSKDAVFGDPVWLLPEFYNPRIEKKYELGVILHLSELADRSYTATNPHPDIVSYSLPAGENSIRLINTCTDISAEALRLWVDEVLSCKRIVSTSLHGMVVGECYQIPCVPFVQGITPGLRRIRIDEGIPIDVRMVDLYRGLGKEEIFVYDRDHNKPLDWEDLIRSIDSNWEVKELDTDRLMQALPLDLAPISAPHQGTVFDHPAIKRIKFKHNVKELRQKDLARWKKSI